MVVDFTVGQKPTILAERDQALEALLLCLNILRRHFCGFRELAFRERIFVVVLRAFWFTGHV